MSPNLTVLLSTINEGIENVPNVILDYRKDVSYIVSHQFTKEEFKYIPKELERKDIVISQIYGKGVTKSRNNAIRLARGDIGLFSDDDVTYTNEYFDKVIEAFRNNNELDVGIFKINTPEGVPEYKKYPLNKMKLEKIPFSIGTIEIAIRVDRIKVKRILFDERFGAGQELLIGLDENIFVLDCIKKGLEVCYFPIFIVNHPIESTAKLLANFDKRRVALAGAYDARINGIISIPKAFLGTLRYLPLLIEYKKNPMIYLIERLTGAFQIIFSHKDSNTSNKSHIR